jgi:hypothetical protein
MFRLQSALAGFGYEPGVLTRGGVMAESLNLELLIRPQPSSKSNPLQPIALTKICATL